MRNQSFAQDEDQADAGTGSNEPEYTFEGVKVEGSEKVMLTPAAPSARK